MLCPSTISSFGPFASIWPRVDHFRSTPLTADMRTGIRSLTLAIGVRAVL